MKTAKEAINELFDFRKPNTTNQFVDYELVLTYCKENNLSQFTLLRLNWLKGYKFIIENNLREKLYSDMNWIYRKRNIKIKKSYDDIVDICKENKLSSFTELLKFDLTLYDKIRQNKLSEKLSSDMNWVYNKKQTYSFEKVINEIESNNINSFAELAILNKKTYMAVLKNSILRNQIIEHTGWVVGVRIEKCSNAKRSEYMKKYYEEKKMKNNLK